MDKKKTMVKKSFTLYTKYHKEIHIYIHIHTYTHTHIFYHGACYSGLIKPLTVAKYNEIYSDGDNSHQPSRIVERSSP